eukprot:TRINITY_DN13251_c0_g1_i1.p1 TRINITY_DN13251_c0_g1~~TRINITY_DN13251_c0_g1_i1.p1  ORF type:complete len:468 (-),score=67.82 TRINITY_DN13251_c0_g1_i1:163-1518(-)
MDLLSASDAAIRLFIESAPWDQYRTKVVDNNNNPVWMNEFFQLFYFQPTILHLIAEDANDTCFEEIGRAEYEFNEHLPLNVWSEISVELKDSSYNYAGTIKFAFMVRKAWEPLSSGPIENQNFPFKNLVIEGSGVRGIAYGGALQVLEELGVTKQLMNVAGSSAGAMTALGLAMGCSATIATETLIDTNFRKFMDGSNTQFMSTYSFYNGEALSHFIKNQIDRTLSRLLPDEELVGTKSQRENLTFLDHSKLVEKYPHLFKNLSVIGTNLTTQKPQVFNAQYSPDFPIWKAVRISMGIPFIFAPINVNGDLYVDGGVAYKYPFDLYDVDGTPNHETLGIRIETPDELADAMGHYWSGTDQMTGPGSSTSKGEAPTLSQYIGDLINLLATAVPESRTKYRDDPRIVYIPTGSVGTSDFKLSEEKKVGLIKTGRDWTEAYFRWWSSSLNQTRR